jgi:hypothetical protein
MTFARGTRSAAAFALPVLLLAACCPEDPPPSGPGVFEQGVNGFAGFADTSIFSENAYSGGASDGIFSGTNAQLNHRRALLRIDLSSIPQGSIITEAALSLTVERSGENFGDLPFTLHRVTRAWGAGAVEGIFQGGFGAPANAGDATWPAARHQQEAWTTPGGDFVALPSAQADAGRAGLAATWDGPGVVADVQSWVDEPETNFGWILISTREGESQRVKKFYSSEARRGRPRLTLTIQPPGEDKLLRLMFPMEGAQ